MKILITGCAGFIGFHLASDLLKKKFNIYGLDNINNYYDIKLKNKRLRILKQFKNFNFYKLDLTETNKLINNFKKNKYDIVINLAAQAGVRHSISNPGIYLTSNVIGYFNILNCAKNFKIKKFIYASSSSVYGNSKKFPLKEEENTDYPLSFYAATKKSNEIFAHAYSHIYNLPTIGLRFFTVYGPYGRPDMSLYKFVSKTDKSETIELYNRGNHIRDFTHIDDVVDAIRALITKKISFKKTPYMIYNIASNTPITLKHYLKTIEKKMNKKAKIKFKELQLGDVQKTHGDIKQLNKLINYKPKIKFDYGIENYVKWYKKFI